MPEQSQRTDITTAQSVTYSEASRVEMPPLTSTTADISHVRTVVTRKTHGKLELRYTPRDPSPIAAKTSL